MQILQDGTLKPVLANQLMRRDHETKNLKKDSICQTDSEGRLECTEQPEEEPTDTSTDLKLKDGYANPNLLLEPAEQKLNLAENPVSSILLEKFKDLPTAESFEVG